MRRDSDRMKHVAGAKFSSAALFDEQSGFLFFCEFCVHYGLQN